MKVGFIGLGAMGAPMAGHLAKKQLLAVVGNRTASKAASLAADLGVVAADATHAFVDCELVLLCVSADADVLQNVEQLATVLSPGSVVVDHSTVARDTAITAAQILAKHQIDFIDAPVSGGVEGARNGRLSVMCGGHPDALEKVRPALECYALRISHMGVTGSGQATKAVNQVMVAGINEAVCEALALGAKLGLDAASLLPTLGSGAANNWFLEKRGATMLAGEFVPGFKCEHMLKDLRIAQATAEAVGIEHPTLRQALDDYATLVREGLGNSDTSALIALKLGKTP